MILPCPVQKRNTNQVLGEIFDKIFAISFAKSFSIERDLIGIHESSERLLLLSSTSDYEETLELSGHLLRNKEQICIHTRLCDAHVYILKKWIVDFLIQVRGTSRP